MPMVKKKTVAKEVGYTRGGLNTKIHFVVNNHDSVHAVESLEKVGIIMNRVLADPTYSAQAIREYISDHGASYVIPPQSNISEP